MIDEKKLLLEHLGELRMRIIFCLVAVVIGMIVSYLCYDILILDIIRGPLDALSGRKDNPFALGSPFLELVKLFRVKLQNPEFDLHYIGPAEGFTVKLRVSFFSGLILVLPFIIYQIWKFISVGLEKKERRIFLIYFPISFLLFAAGVLFAYFIMSPAGLYFLISVSSGLKPMFTISKYTSIIILLISVFGLIFELPLVILFLTRIGVVTPKFLAKKRKYAILLMFILSAILTPPDVFTQFMLAIPVIILYEISIWISKIASARRKDRNE